MSVLMKFVKVKSKKISKSVGYQAIWIMLLWFGIFYETNCVHVRIIISCYYMVGFTKDQ